MSSTSEEVMDNTLWKCWIRFVETERPVFNVYIHEYTHQCTDLSVYFYMLLKLCCYRPMVQQSPWLRLPRFVLHTFTTGPHHQSPSWSNRGRCNTKRPICMRAEGQFPAIRVILTMRLWWLCGDICCLQQSGREVYQVIWEDKVTFDWKQGLTRWNNGFVAMHDINLRQRDINAEQYYCISKMYLPATTRHTRAVVYTIIIN